MPKLRSLGRYDSVLSMISAQRTRETSAARKILAILAPLDDLEADNVLELIEEVLDRCEDDTVQGLITRRAGDVQQLALVEDNDTPTQSSV